MEKLALYNKDRVLVETTIERGNPIPSGLYRLVVHLAILSNDNKMLIQKRSKDKNNWASKWDISVGGCVVAGENSSIGIERELKEELGIDYDFSNTRPNMSFTFDEGFDDIYIIRTDIDINKCVLQKEEVECVRYASMEEIFEMIKSQEFVQYDENLIRLIFTNINDDGIFTETKKK